MARIRVSGIVISLMCLSVRAADWVVVDVNGGGVFTEIQPAIDAAADGDTVLVAPGEYIITEPIDFNRLHAPDDPGSPPVKNLALRAMGHPGQTIIRMGELLTDRDRASVVVFQSGESEDSVLEGFTLTGGRGAILSNHTGVGGGALCRNGPSPRFVNCVFSENSATGTVVDCVGSHCVTTSGGGGAVYCEDSSPSLENCSLRNNSATGASHRGGSVGMGGGILCAGTSAPRLAGCEIRDNSANGGSGMSSGPGRGGGLFCTDESSPVLTRCRIAGNSARGGGFWGGGRGTGGGVYCEGSSAPTLINCLIAGNLSLGGSGRFPRSGDGGGIYCAGESSAILANCTITENKAWWGGSTIIPLPPGPGSGGGILSTGMSRPTLMNCIVVNNPSLTSLGFEGESVPEVASSCLEDDGVLLPPGNILLDPLFVQRGLWEYDSWTPGDYRLRSDSPCVDSGAPQGAPTTDIDGNGRPCGAGVDMGAYESGDCSPTPNHRFVRGDCNADGTVDIADAIFTLAALFLGDGDPGCDDACDSNDDGAVDISDPIATLGALFLGNAVIPLPGMTECGIDPTDDQIGCTDFGRCP